MVSDDYGGLHFLLNLNCKQEDVKEIIKGKMPSFYQDILEAWFVLLNKCISMQCSLVGMTTLDIKERYCLFNNIHR